MGGGFIEESAQDKIFEFITPRDLPIFTFLRFTGARPNEARGLLRENIRWENKQIVIKTVLGMDGKLKARTKTGKLRVLPIIPELEESLKPRGDVPLVFAEGREPAFSRNGRAYSRRMLEKTWHRANRLANKQYGTPSDIRSTERYGKYQTAKLVDVMRGKRADRKAAPFTPEKPPVHNTNSLKYKDKMAGVGGFEPPNAGSKDLCLTA